jgi:hypothetical protein
MRKLKLFGHEPSQQGPTHVIWGTKQWWASVWDRGTTWGASFMNLDIGLAYSSKGAAKAAIENHVRRQYKTACLVMGKKL